jgi:predicted nucleotidyltransferase
MTLRLTDEELAFLQEVVVAPLAASGYRVWCFGSRARGEGARYADVDLLVTGTGKPRGLIGELSERLVESRFPYKVDLVLESDLAESYREGIMAERVLLDPRSS